MKSGMWLAYIFCLECFAQKNDSILLVQNLPGTRLPGCLIFFDCKSFLRNRLAKILILPFGVI